MKNPKVGERVKSETGMRDEGIIINVVSDKKVDVNWHYQDDFKQVSKDYPVGGLDRVEEKRCSTCGKML